MRFTTASGTEYIVTDVEQGEDGIFTGLVTRIGVPLRHVETGRDMEPVEVDRFRSHALPEVGRSFFYSTAIHNGCVSTPVTSIEDE